MAISQFALMCLEKSLEKEGVMLSFVEPVVIVFLFLVRIAMVFCVIAEFYEGECKFYYGVNFLFFCITCMVL